MMCWPTRTQHRSWCTDKNLELNVSKTVEMVMKFQKHPPWHLWLLINNAVVKVMEFSVWLRQSPATWNGRNSSHLMKQGHQRMLFLRLLRKMNISANFGSSSTEPPRGVSCPHLLHQCVVPCFLCPHQTQIRVYHANSQAANRPGSSACECSVWWLSQ